MGKQSIGEICTSLRANALLPFWDKQATNKEVPALEVSSRAGETVQVVKVPFPSLVGKEGRVGNRSTKHNPPAQRKPCDYPASEAR